MSTLVLVHHWQLHHDIVSEAIGRQSCPLPHVHLEATHVPGCCLGDGPDFEAPLDGLSRQVPLHKWASLEGDHCLVDRQLSPRTVPPRKRRRRRWQQWPDLVKMIVSCVTSSSCRAVVISLKILHQLLEVMLGHDYHHARHPRHVVWRPLLYFFGCRTTDRCSNLPPILHVCVSQIPPFLLPVYSVRNNPHHSTPLYIKWLTRRETWWHVKPKVTRNLIWIRKLVTRERRTE